MSLFSDISKKIGTYTANNITIAKPQSGMVVSGTQPTAYQFNLAEPVQQKQKTTRDVLGSILKVAETNPEYAQKKMKALSYLQSDPTSSFYYPYYNSTNNAHQRLAELGFDSSVINDDWWNNNKDWQNYLVYGGTTNSPTKPTKTGKSAEQYNTEMTSYWLNQLYKEKDTSAAVQKEWAAMQDELTYWTNRADLNLSDDEIVAKVNKDKKSKYPTLYKLDQSLTDPDKNLIELNEGTDYSPDNMYGVVWAARNGKAGDPIIEYTAQSGAGYGKQWEDNPEIREKLEWGTPNYSPFSVKSTMDEACCYFNKPYFTKEDIANLKVDENDATAVKMYNQLIDAEGFTEKAEEEVALVDKWLSTKLETATDPEKLMKSFDAFLDANCPNLKKMDNSMKKIDSLVDTTRPIDYSRNDVFKKVNEACAKNTGKDTFGQTMDKCGVDTGTDENKALFAAGDQKVVEVAFSYSNGMTDSEQTYFTYAPSAHNSEYADIYRQTIDQMNDLPEKTQAQVATDYVTGYIPLYNQVTQNRKAKSTLDVIMPEWTEMNEKVTAMEATGLTPEQYRNLVAMRDSGAWDAFVEDNHLQSLLEHPEAAMKSEGTRARYENAMLYVYQQVTGDYGASSETVFENGEKWLNLLNMNGDLPTLTDEELNRYENLSTVKRQQEAIIEKTAGAQDEFTQMQNEFLHRIDVYRNAGISTAELRTAQFISQTITGFANYDATIWTPYDKYDQMMRDENGDLNGYTFDQVKQSAIDENEKDALKLKNYKWYKEYIEENGIELPDNYISNLNRGIEKLEREQDAFDYFMLRGNADFKEGAEKGREMEKSKDIGELDYKTIADSVADNSFGTFDAIMKGLETSPFYDIMTQEEKDTYYYLRSQKDGFIKAAEYYEFLANPTYGVLNTRNRQNIEKGAVSEVNSGILGGAWANVKSIASAPLDFIGNATNMLYSALNGKELNPDAAFRASSQYSSKVNAETVQAIHEGLKDSPVLDTLLSGIYEIVYNRGRSAVNAAMFGWLTKYMDTDLVKEIVGAMPMAFDAAGTAAANAKERGAQDWQAYTIAGITAFAESVTEGLTYGNIHEALYGADQELATRTFKDLMANWLTSSGIEEMIGESANDIIENLGDRYILGALSEHQASVNEWIEKLELDPNNPADVMIAEDYATKDEMAALLHTAIISYLSPGLDVFTGTISDTLRDVRNVRNITNTLKERDLDISAEEIRNEYKQYKDDIASGKYKYGEGYKQEGITENQRMIRAAAEGIRNAPTDAQIEQARQEAEAQAEAEYQQRRMSDADDQFIKDLSAFDTSEKSDAVTQTAALAAIFGRTNNTQDIHLANAAAILIQKAFGGLSNAVTKVKSILNAAHQFGIDYQNVKTALEVASLSESSQAAQVVASEEFQNATPEQQAEMLASTVEGDMQNQTVMEEANNAIRENRINEKEAKLAEDGAYDELEDKRIYYEAEQHSLSVAEQEVEDHRREEEIKVNYALNDATNAANEMAMNPTDENRNWVDRAMGAFNKATEVMESVVKQWEEHRDKIVQAVQDAKEKYENALRDKQTEVRQQAEQMVDEEDQQLAEAAAQQEEQARIEAEQAEQARLEEEENNNFARAQADEIIAENYANATPEQQDKIRSIVKDIRSEKPMSESDKILARRDYVKRIGKKFGYDIRIGDTTEGGRFLYQNASVSPETGVITLSKEATLSDAMYAILGHEVTHIAQEAGEDVYNELADALIKLEYGDNAEQVEADIMARHELYTKGLTVLQQQGKNVDPSKVDYKYAKEELVADLMGKLFLDENGNANTELLNRFAAESPNVAMRVLNAIKSFLKKMVGIQDAPLTEAQRIVDILESALKQADINNQGTVTRYALKPGEANAIRIKNGTMKGTGEPVNFIDLILDNKKLGETRAYDPNNNNRLSRTQWLGLENDGLVYGRAKFGDPILITKDSPEYQNAYIAGTDFDIEEGGQKLYYPVLETEDFRDNPIRTHRNGSLYQQYMERAKPIATDNSGNDIADELPGGTVTVNPVRYSLSSFNDEEVARVRQALYSAKNPDGTNRFTRKQVNDYIDNALGVAAVIAADRNRLDFDASDNQVFLKPNNDYYFTLDASTLCAKRLLYQGTFDYVQHALPDEVFTPEDLIDLVNIMNEMGYETPCGICYVESRRRWLDTYAQRFLDTLPEEGRPSIDDLTTSDGLEKLRHSDPDMYQKFVDAMNKKGTANPKLVQLRTEYRGDIYKNMTDRDVQKVKDIGGLRIQSFSDFETPHLLDMMQAVLDMSARGLTSQAYTKVPNFAWVFGDTGIKINLSLIGEGTGLDENGNLVFDNREGINFDEAMKLREKYGKNVGTILVGINDDHIVAAMGDPRIDFIIPFHKSGWSAEELRKMPTLNNYKDYTNTQNERMIIKQNEDGSYETESFKKHKERTGESFENFQPVGKNGYWNFKKSGQWNAENYLKMCAEQHRIPKFSQFLVDNGDGSFSLPKGKDQRSTAIREGYWKTLIDFKMYENDSYGRTKEDGTKTKVKGSEQKEVRPNINMAEAYRVLNDYELGRQMPDQANGTKGKFIKMENNNSVPVAVPAAEQYIELIRNKRAGNKPAGPGPNTLEADLPADAQAGWVNPRANAFGAVQTPAVLGNTESTENVNEDYASQQGMMAVNPETGESERVRFSLPVENKETLDFLNKQEESGDVIKTYRTMKLLDGKLTSPKATKINGSVEAYSELGQWEEATEHPELIKFDKKGSPMFILDEGKRSNGKDKKIPARYNPYMHSSNLMLNDQFSVAYQYSGEDPNLGKFVTVECIVPKSEETSGYQAQYAKDPVGWTDWKSGGVAQKIEKAGGEKRNVFLSRWIKPVRIVPDSEVAQHYKQLLDGTDIEVPANVVTPNLLEELKKAGVKIGEPQSQYADDYNAATGVRYSLPSDAPYLSAVNHGDMEEAQRMVDDAAENAMAESAIRDEEGNLIKVYHGTSEQFTVFDMGKGRSTMDIQGSFFSPWELDASGYGENVGVYYLDIKNPAPEQVAYAALRRHQGENEAGRKAKEDLIAAGYDGVNNSNEEYIAFYPEQIKSADPVTYDDNGEIIPLSERFNTKQPDIRYSLPSDNILEQQIRYQIQNGDMTQEDIDAYQEKTSRPLEGRSARWSQTEGPAQRQFATGMLQDSDEIAQQAKDYALAHNAMFPDTNEAQIDRAINWIRKNGSQKSEDGSYTQTTDGYSESLAKVTSKNFDYRSADGQARMVAMMGMAVAKNDVMAQVALVDAFNRQGTDLGRALQARKLFRLMTPEGRINSLQKMLDNTQDELDAKGKNVDLKFSDWIYMAAAAATEEGDFQKVQQAAAQELAEQLPANWKDRIRSIRMLSMLANPRTHIRNIIGNAMFIPAVGLKNKLGAIAELGVKEGEKTKTLSPFLSKEARRFAREDVMTMKDELTGEAKYNEDSMVQREQKAFKGLLQGLIDFNSNALEKEDWKFLKGHYIRALGGWMMANGYTESQLRSDQALLEKGRAYAVQEAQKATYRDFNQLAKTLNEVSRKGGVAGFLVDAVLPFKKTPANILKRGIEYSPAGIMRSLTTDLYHLKQWNDYQGGKLNALPDKALSPTQFIDRLCSGLSGTAVMALGALLSSAGIVTVGLDDDDDELEKAKGNQEYAFKFSIGGKDYTFTMDWAAPMSMPFFVGSAIYEQLANQEGFDVEELVNAFGNITEPVFNLSMLDGVNTLFKTSQYDDTNTLTQIGAKIASNYATSYVPSLLGAVARTVDENRRKAYVESGKGTGIIGTFRYAREQTENKIPGLSQTNIPYRNVWGNEETSGLAERILENFILPGYISEYKDDPILNEMSRLYDATGDASMIPSDPAKSVTYKKQKYVLTAEQWDHYKEVRGQTAFEVLGALIDTDSYKNADTSTQVQMIKDAWSYADAIGKSTFIPDYEVPKMGSNPTEKIAKDATITGYKNEMIKALNANDWEAYDTMVEALREADVEESTIKTKISDTYRDQWKDAYRKNDEAKMAEIEEILDNTGFSFNIYGKGGWMQKVDEEND